MLNTRQSSAQSPVEISDYAEQILSGLSSYVIPSQMRHNYRPEIQSEIESTVATFRNAIGTFNKRRLQRILINDNPFSAERSAVIRADRRIWAQIRKPNPNIDFIEDRILHLEAGRGRISALIALRKLLGRAPERVEAFLTHLAENTSLADEDLTEWARISLQEIALMRGADSSEILALAACSRTVRHYPDRVFDVTMPLFFECRAITRVGRLEIETQISPLWFTQIFGDAMAMVRARTFRNRLVLEKQVAGLHPDGTMHYEHFPFFGETIQVSPSVLRHDYWASVRRPFYASGRVEDVSNGQPVYRENPMTFFRLAHTFTHPRYAVDSVPMPESVRGVFFGFGHAEPRLLMRKAGNLAVGDFQISPHINPHTRELANTTFFGTFFGKLERASESGVIALNERAVHCDTEGRLDYYGDGAMAPDPIRPLDW